MKRSHWINIFSTVCGIAFWCSGSLFTGACAGGLGGHRGGGGAGMNRGGFGGGGMPNVSRPNVGAMPNRPAMPQMPISRPQTSVPHLGGNSFPNANVQMPQVNRPTTRPQVTPGANVPTNKLPGGGNLGNNLDKPRPNIADKPLARPSSPTGNTRLPGGNLNPEGMPDFSNLPAGRPSASDLGNYLGLDRPVRPETKPAIPERPNVTAPNVTAPNVTRPNVMRPSTERPPVNISDINLGNNTNISTRPAWVNINQNQITQINHQWQGQLGSLANWPTTYPARVDNYHRWGNDLRRNWAIDPGYCRPAWWNNHPFHCSGWHYFGVYWRYPYSYWWTTPSYNQVAQWLAWSAVAGQVPQPAYYDYSNGGNVTYEDNRVYVAGQPVATVDEFAASAAALATVEAPKSEKDVEQTEWMPLGTFALTTSADDVEATKIVQLAVDKNGIVSGTLHDKTADTVVAIQGRVDKETQRVAVRVGDSNRVVAETGLYNLTQDEASVLVHFGDITQDSCLLVRLPDPEAKQTPSNSK